MRLKLLIIGVLIFSGSCKEFYDEEFLEDDLALQQAGNANYEVALASTDPALTSLTGSGRIEVKDTDVQVNVELEGIPQNIIQIHYSFINAGCDSLNISIPNEAGTTRSYTINETLSTESLAQDLQSSGAASSAGDINLEGKSFIIRAFPNFSGLPNPAGTNSVTIACGLISVSTAAPEPAPVPDPAEEGPVDPFEPAEEF